MKANSLKEIKTELIAKNSTALVQICLKLAKFKKENKEMLSFLLFGLENKENYIEQVKTFIQSEFMSSHLPARQKLKTIRKALRTLKKHIRYIDDIPSEIHLRLWFCQILINNSSRTEIKGVYQKLLETEIRQMEGKTSKLHEDLIFDIRQELAEIKTQL